MPRESDVPFRPSKSTLLICTYPQTDRNTKYLKYNLRKIKKMFSSFPNLFRIKRKRRKDLIRWSMPFFSLKCSLTEAQLEYTHLKHLWVYVSKERWVYILNFHTYTLRRSFCGEIFLYLHATNPPVAKPKQTSF